MLKKQKISNAFTLVELMIVVAIIAILAGMVTFAAVTTQRTTRDSSRDAKVRIIAEALEKYYNANGEYPSVAFMTGSDVNPIKQKLGIADATVFKFPNSSAANSITSSSPSSTQLQYLASTTDSTKNSQCQTDVDGYCDAFQLKYTKEVNGSVATVDSRHSDFVAVTAPSSPINYSDDFTSSGTLGNVKTGNPLLAWQFLNSTSSNWSRNSGGYATTTVAASSNPMAVADFSTPNVTIVEGVKSVGDAIYFRAADGDDWMRARVDMTTSSSTSSWYTDYFDYQVRNEPTWYSAGNPPIASTASQAVQNCYDYAQAGINSGNYTATRGCGDAVYNTNTSTTNTYYLVLDKSVNGTVTQLASKSLGTSLPAFIKVTAKGNNLQTFYGSTNETTSTGSSITDSANQSETKHGVGYASTSSGSPTGINSFAIINAQ